MVTKPQITETLQRARDRIADPKHWCKKDYAKNAAGNYVDYDSKNSVSWCAEGAVMREVGNNPLLRKCCFETLQENLDVIWHRGVTDFNDAVTLRGSAGPVRSDDCESQSYRGGN